MRKIVYFINPISGTKDKAPFITLLKEKTKSAGLQYEIWNTEASGKYPWLAEKIKKENITDIVICGGDGTINNIASHLIHSDVNIGIIPCGSGNGLAFCAKIPKETDKALDIVFNGRSSFIDAFYINENFSCMLCGIGFDAQVAHDFAKQKKRGLPTYIKQTIRNFFTAPLYPFTIKFGKNKLSFNAYFISIANSNQFGNNFTIAPKASLSDGLLDIVAVKKMNKLKMLWAVYRQLKFGEVTNFEEPESEKEILYFQTTELIIENKMIAPLHIDGDPAITSGAFNVKIIPKAFRLLQP